ncbi:hypothetical protein IJ21_17730 [Paenibacillus sp. 32O-W]|nr:hypothetical protein IJ21_17730 [Paenibacillus sp. 32O-W]
MNIHRQLLINDFFNRWGGAQECKSCGHVLPYGPHDKLQRCCGKSMELVRRLPDESQAYGNDCPSGRCEM